MKIGIGADHRGFLHKEYIKQHMQKIDWIDVGTFSEDRVDYPLFCTKIVDLMCQNIIMHAVLVCGSGGGMAIAANRHKNIYAVVSWNDEIAIRCKQEDNANILVLPSDFITHTQTVNMIEKWLASDFKEGRYAQRLAMIDK